MRSDLDCKSLVRSSKREPIQFQPEHVVLIGSGANSLSWFPAYDAIKRHLEGGNNSGFLRGVEQSSDFSLILATCSYAYRSFRDRLSLELINGTFNSSSLQKYGKHLEWFCDLRKKIGQCYVSASGQFRPSLSKLLDNIDFDKTAVVTTNWDLLLWKDRRISNLLQLHGRADQPNSLIFPSELSTDENLVSAVALLQKQDKISVDQAIVSSSIFSRFSQNYCRDEFASQLRNAHNVAINWTSCARKITCLGVAFNIYDAEQWAAILYAVRTK